MSSYKLSRESRTFPRDLEGKPRNTKLLISAIEVAEYNHALNSEKECRHWRWLFQTCAHWHAIVYLLIEISRRQWSPIIERAWTALHSKWLIPLKFTNQTERDQNSRIWVPLRKLMAKTRKHCVAELQRLRQDSWSAIQLEIDDTKIPLPASPVPSYDGNCGNIFLERWRGLVAKPPQIENEKRDIGIHTPTTVDTVPIDWYNQFTAPNIMSSPWTDADPSSGIFADIDMNMDLDMDVNWYEWIESAQSMEH